METAILQVRLFGDLELRHGQDPLPPFESSRVESLLAYLLLHRDAPQPRQRIAFHLWPDSTEAQARTNLRHLLHTLRRTFPDAERFIEVTPRTLQWRPDALYWLDVAAFEEAVARSDDKTVVDLYRGDLLEGCYDEWLLGERERLRQQYLQSLDHLARSLEASGDHFRAISYAEQLLRHDPLYEDVYRLLMRLHGAQGDRARAVRVYHECAATLERELGVVPSPPTQRAYEALLVPEPEPSARLEQAGQRRAPLIGRAAEWERLTSCWRAAENGLAQLVLVTGEPGIGKTRLVEEFRTWCAQRGALTAEARSYAAEGALAYGPVVAWLRSDALGMRRNWLDHAVLTDLARLLPEVRIDHPDLPGPEPSHESDQRQRLFDALVQAILAPDAPLLLIINDLHWSDRETLQFLHYLLRVEPAARLLVAATARDEELVGRRPLNDLLTGLRALERVTEIELGRLSRQETVQLAGRLSMRPLDATQANELYQETEGNPLFVVEALRAGWASGRPGDGWMSPKIQAAIESRLAQLSESTRNLVGLAATVGREFTSEVLSSASQVDDEELVRGLDELWQRRIFREHGSDAYDFSHDKIREVAYLALSPALRRHYHLRVARALEQLHGHDPGPVSGQLAAHYEQAGAVDQAVSWYVRAAEMAQQLNANVDAARLFERALTLLGALPDIRERQTRELEILTALPAALVAIEGYGSRRLTEIHARALDLMRALGVEPDPPMLRSLAVAALSHNDFHTAQQYGEQLYRHGKQQSDDILLAQSEYVLGITAFWKGELEAARRYFEGAVDRVRPEHRREHLLHYGHDPGSTCLMRLACTLWFLGYPNAAIRARDAALALTEGLGHPFSRTLVLVFAGVLALEMRDAIRLRACIAELIAGRIDAYTVHVRGMEVLFGYTEVLDGRASSGIARIQRTLDDPDLSDQMPGQTAIFLRVLLEACSVAGDARAGLVAADRLIELSSNAGLWEAEAHRFRAEFLAALGAPDVEAEVEIEAALRIARRQGARILELRAASSLVRQLQQRGDRDRRREMRELLASIVNTLPERSDVPDLREAEQLIDMV